jgi:hypothetical protein
MKKIFLIFIGVSIVVGGIIKGISENKNYLTIKEMKNISAGQCYNRSCTTRELCGITNGILVCLGRDFNAPCAPACESGFKVNKRCDGSRLPSGWWCEQQSYNCDKGKDGFCIGRLQQNHNIILYCVADPFSQNEYLSCGPVTDCINKSK